MATKKLRSFGILLTLGLFALLSLAYRSTSPFLQTTPTPGPRGKPIPLEAQAGNSDGILVLGILIFIFIAVPILLRVWETKTSRPPNR
jgi:hypothetical protein